MKINGEKLEQLKYGLTHPDIKAAGRRIAGAVTEGWYVPGDGMSKDRVRLLGYNYEANVVANLIGGTFYTGLLLLMNADDAFIGSMSMISSAANMLQMFAPLLLERFPRRKKLLIILRCVIMFFNVLFLGLIPLFPVGRQVRLTLVAGTILIVNVINAFTSPGLSVWTIQSVPQNVRGSFFTLITMTVGAVVALFNLAGSAVVDWFSARGMEYVGLLSLRLFCVALLIADTISFAKIKEYPYPGTTGKYTLKDLILKPLSEKKYLRTVCITFLWNIAANIPGSYYTVYLLRDVQVNYSFIMLCSMLNVPIVLLLTPVWSKLGRKFDLSWFKMLYIAMSMYLMHYVLLAFVTAKTLWLYPVALILAYVTAIGINLSFTCIPYVNIPERNQTAFIGFYSTVANLAVFIGVFIGRMFVTHTETAAVDIGIMTLTGKQLLVLLTGGMMLISVILIRAIDRLNARDDKREAEQKLKAENTDRANGEEVNL